MKTIPVAILGTGKIGTDLLIKVIRSSYMHCACFVGRRDASEGMAVAREHGVPTSAGGIDFLCNHPELYDMVFDATSAEAHVSNQKVFARHGKKVFDLTPSHIGEAAVPAINPEAVFSAGNINLVSCGGQAALPILYAISQICPNISYMEFVNTASSRSAGTATRQNLDEYIHTSEAAARKFTGCGKVKALALLNPADPPVHMHTTITVMAGEVDEAKIREAVLAMVARVQKYAPGYSILADPICGSGKVTVLTRTEGRGDYLEKYAGNLDIINSAAAYLADVYAIRLLEKRPRAASLQTAPTGDLYAKRKISNF